MHRGRWVSLLVGLVLGLVAGFYVPLPPRVDSSRPTPEDELLRIVEAWRAKDAVGVFARLEPRLQRELTLDRVYADLMGRSAEPSALAAALEGAERHVRGGGRFTLVEDDAFLEWSSQGDSVVLLWSRGRWRLAEIGRRSTP